MPKLKDRPPKYCKMNGQAVVYCNGRPHYLGKHGSPESHVAYARYVAESKANPIVSPLADDNVVDDFRNVAIPARVRIHQCP